VPIEEPTDGALAEHQSLLGQAPAQFLDREVRCCLQHGHCGLSQICFELGEGILDRIEVRAVRRKIEERSAGRLDHLAYARPFVAGEVIHDDDGVVWKLG
jgi:hypothetical protein